MRLKLIFGLRSLRLLPVLLAVCECTGNRPVTQKRRMVTILYDIGTCTDRQHHIEVHNMTYSMNEWGGTLVSADVRFRKGMKNVSKLVVVLTRCTGGKAPNLCEYYQRMVWTTALCQLMAAKGMLWTPFYDKVKPTFSCPIQKGLYTVRNATLDPEVGRVWVPNVERHIWPMDMQLYDGSGELVACFLATAEVRFVKGKRKPPNA